MSNGLALARPLLRPRISPVGQLPRPATQSKIWRNAERHRGMYAICQLVIYRRATGQELKGLANTLQRWLAEVPNSCRCSVAGNGIRDLRRGQLPTPECRRLDTSLDDLDLGREVIDGNPPPADRDPRVEATPGDSTGAVVIHIEYGSQSGYDEAIESLRNSLSPKLVADLSEMKMDWLDDDE